MKKAIIVGLVCLNIALLVAVAFVATAPPAKAQGAVAGTDYLAFTADVSSNNKLIYVIDLGKQKMACWRFDKTARNNAGGLVAFAMRELPRDFGGK
jgi:hypothetical protein